MAVVRALIILALTAPLCWLSGAAAFTRISGEANVAAALRVNPNDAAALALKADQLILKSPDRPSSPQIIEMARKSLLEQGLNPRALRVMSFVTESEKGQARTRSAVQLAARLSRREVGTQLWLIEDSVGREDVRSALTHYDIALRTSASSAEVLFPILNQALEDDTLKAEFARFLKTPPSWMPAFLGYAIGSGQDPSPLASTITRAGGLPVEKVYRTVETSLLGQLEDKRKYLEARAFFESLRGADKSLLTSSSFDEKNTNPRFAPISWQIFDMAGVSVSFRPSERSKSQSLHVAVASGERNFAARKVMFLSPGGYRVRQAIKFDKPSDGAAAYWEVVCLRSADSLPIWRGDGSMTQTATPLMMSVVVPVDCPTQALQLTVAGGANQDGAEISFAHISLDPQQ